MEQLLRVLMLLSGIRNYSIAEMSERFNKSGRSIYRYLDAIEKAGFVLDRKEDPEGCRYRLITHNATGKSLEKLLHFSQEEACLLYQTLSELKVSSPLKERLVKKLHTLYDFKALTQLEKDNELQQVHTIGDAIKDKRQVILLQYRSSNSGVITDRKVEPFEFMEDYKAIWCFDIESNTNKQFKIARMGQVELLSACWHHEAEHRIPFTDAFRMSADIPISTVEAVLTLKACNLLLEEYPLAEKYIRKEDRRYHLKISIADYQGIGRFVMGLPGEVKVFGPEEFKKFLKEKRKISFD